MDIKKKKSKMTSILRQSYLDYLTTKTSKTNGFDTIEIGLVTLRYKVLTTFWYPTFSISLKLGIWLLILVLFFIRKLLIMVFCSEVVLLFSFIFGSFPQIFTLLLLLSMLLRLFYIYLSTTTLLTNCSPVSLSQYTSLCSRKLSITLLLRDFLSFIWIGGI